MKTYEYIWLDGYQPEPSMRSKVKATKDEKLQQNRFFTEWLESIFISGISSEIKI